MATALSHKLPLLPAEVSKPVKLAEVCFQLLLLVGGIALGAFTQLSGPAWARSIFEQVRIDSPDGIGTLLLAVLASIFAHELGHLFAALYLNFEVLGGALGPLRVEWWHNRAFFQIQAEGNWSRCSISAVPLEVHNCWRARMLLVVAAGPAVTLIFLAAAASMALHGRAGSPWEVAFWSSCAEVNFFLFILGLVPNGRTATVRNDAALFRALWRNNEDAVDMLRCHQAIELSLRGVRPDYYPEPLLLELASFQGQPYTNLMVARRMVEWAIASGNPELAGEWDQSALAVSALCGSRHANQALAESACFDVMFRDNMQSASHKFATLDFNSLFPPFLAERARAAHWVARDLSYRAPSHILRAQYHLPLGNSYYDYERILLDKLHVRACRKGIAAACGSDYSIV
jgi:hypothetical protein